MGFLTLFLIAISLSMDAFAVSVSNSMCYSRLTKGQMVATSASFGLFQGLMPLLGFFAGQALGSVMDAVDHWVVLVLLGFIGGKMIVEGIKALRNPLQCPAEQSFTAKTMLAQSVATSIDALAVGVGFAAMSANIWVAAGAIALVTFLCCLVGGFFGKRFNLLLGGDWAQIVGGLVLVGIGLKIFIEHMMAVQAL